MNLTYIVPSCLILNEKQREILKKFIEDNSQEFQEISMTNIEEDCCGGGAVHFEIRTSGIGPEVHAVMGKHRVWLDDGLEP